MRGRDRRRVAHRSRLSYAPSRKQPIAAPGDARVGQAVGGLLALLSVAGPMMAVTDSGTRIALALMHVVVGVAAVAALEVIRRRT